MAQGTVKRFDSNRGQGFISPDDGSGDVFVHYSVGGKRRRPPLEAGQRVEFEVTPGSKGPQAENVRVVG